MSKRFIKKEGDLPLAGRTVFGLLDESKGINTSGKKRLSGAGFFAFSAVAVGLFAPVVVLPASLLSVAFSLSAIQKFLQGSRLLTQVRGRHSLGESYTEEVIDKDVCLVGNSLKVGSVMNTLGEIQDIPLWVSSDLDGMVIDDQDVLFLAQSVEAVYQALSHHSVAMVPMQEEDLPTIVSLDITCPALVQEKRGGDCGDDKPQVNLLRVQHLPIASIKQAYNKRGGRCVWIEMKQTAVACAHIDYVRKNPVKRLL